MAHTLKDLLNIAVENGASDLHINDGIPAQIRVDGSLRTVDEQSLTSEDSKKICYECLNQEQVMRLDAQRSIDLSFQINGLSRFRANIFYSMNNICGAFRAIPFKIPSPTELGIPDRVVKLTDKPRGLILVTGQTGSGKSTTLASLIEIINKSRHDHIITIEDPIEYMFEQKKCLINQREIGPDAKTFASALKYILRQDPDVVLVGEMRDLETIQSAITVAETGHLVFATLHTNSAAQTIDRIIDVFPPHNHQQIRTQLSFILEGIISQQLLQKIGGGRALAMEMMFPNSGIRNLIREGKTHQIASQMQTGQEHTGMIMMDQSLTNLVKNGIVSLDNAIRRAQNHEDFQNYMKR